MRPLDPALVRRVAPVRWLVLACGALTVMQTAATVVQAVMLARLLASAVGGAPGTGRPGLLAGLATAILVRALAAAAAERMAGRASGAAVRELRRQALTALGSPGNSLRRSHSPATLQPLLGSGLDGLHAYLGRYLPALVQAALVPAAITVVLVATDPLSALIVALTLPLVVVFMAMIGWYTASATGRSLAAIRRLAGRFADVTAGMPALVVFDRVRSQARAVGAVAGEHRRASTAVLRIAFLSSMVLELVATLSVALVAVTCGLRLVSGSMTMTTALVVLLLAPEAYLPLRAVGARFHAAADGVTATGQVLRLIDGARPAAGRRTDLAAVPAVRMSAVAVHFADRRSVRIGDADFAAGAVTVLRGPSGSGKSTALALLAGLDRPDSGSVRVQAAASFAADPVHIDLLDVDPRYWRQRVAWCGQRVALLPGTLLSNLVGPGRVDAPRLRRVLDACRLSELVEELPDGLHTRIGEAGGVDASSAGRGLSTGQRRRIGLARAVYSSRPILLLDEPTEGLDADSEQSVVRGIAPLLAGRTVVITTHRPAVLALADAVVELPESSRATPGHPGPVGVVDR